MKDGEAGDDDRDEDGPREPDPEGRVEKYIGVKVKVCISCGVCISCYTQKLLIIFHFCKL